MKDIKEKIRDLNGNTLQKFKQENCICFGNVKSLFADYQNYTVLAHYLHIAFNPITNEDINELKKHLVIPSVVLDFLKTYNGLSLFSNSLELYGFGYIKNITTGLYEKPRNQMLPMDLISENSSHKTHLKVGTFCEQAIVIINNEPAIVNKKEQVVKTFKNYYDLIINCINILQDNYEPTGRSKKPLIMGKLIFNKTVQI